MDLAEAEIALSMQKFNEVESKAKQALDLAGTQDKQLGRAGENSDGAFSVAFGPWGRRPGAVSAGSRRRGRTDRSAATRPVAALRG